MKCLRTKRQTQASESYESQQPEYEQHKFSNPVKVRSLNHILSNTESSVPRFMICSENNPEKYWK